MEVTIFSKKDILFYLKIYNLKYSQNFLHNFHLLLKYFLNIFCENTESNTFIIRNNGYESLLKNV